MDTSLQSSIEKHESYIKADPHNPLLWVAMGDLYHRAGRLEEALASFERSQLEAPESPAAKSRIASGRISQHRFAQAAAILRELAGAQPDSAALLYNLGLTQFYQDKWREAQASFDRALALGLKTRDNLAYLTRSLHHLGKTREAIGSCEQWLAQAPGEPGGASRALLEMDDGNMARAQELAQDVLARDPENLHASAVAGSYSVEQQDMEAAERFFGRILERPRLARDGPGAPLSAEARRCDHGARRGGAPDAGQFRDHRRAGLGQARRTRRARGREDLPPSGRGRPQLRRGARRARLGARAPGARRRGAARGEARERPGPHELRRPLRAIGAFQGPRQDRGRDRAARRAPAAGAHARLEAPDRAAAHLRREAPGEDAAAARGGRWPADLRKGCRTTRCSTARCLR